MENNINLKLHFIGTGAAVTDLKRFHTSFILSYNSKNILIDCGDGISKKLKEFNYDLNNIDYLLITHLHPDHFSGLASLLVQMKFLKRNKQLNIILNKELINFIEIYLNQMYVFKDRLPFRLNFIPFEIENKIIIEESIELMTKQNSHLDKYKNWKYQKLIKLISPSFLFDINGKKIHYSSDIGNIKDLSIFDSEVDISIIETSHIDIADIKSFIITELSKKYFLVHIDENKDKILKDQFRDEIGTKKVLIPNDGDEYFL